MLIKMNRKIFITTLVFSSLTSLNALSQHRDESQMLRPPVMTVEEARQRTAANTQISQLDPNDPENPLRPVDESEEAGREYLVEAIRLFMINDNEAGLISLNKASREGNHDAQYRLAVMYREGIILPMNHEDAAYWFRKAASNGHAPSQYQIGLCFLNGDGVLQDKRVAGEWFWRAAEQGHPMAYLYVARMYRDSDGMDKDLRRAAKYMKQAADANIEGALQELEEINRLNKTSGSSQNGTKAKGKSSKK